MQGNWQSASRAPGLCMEPGSQSIRSMVAVGHDQGFRERESPETRRSDQKLELVKRKGLPNVTRQERGREPPRTALRPVQTSLCPPRTGT